MSHSGSRNDPLYPSDVVLHHLRAKNKGPEGGAPYGYPGVPHTSHVSHSGNRNDPLCPSDAVLHHLRARNKGPEGGARYWYPGVPNTSHVSGTEMIHFFHQM